MRNLILVLLTTMLSQMSLKGQENQKRIDEYINQEILVDNGWAGESFTLIEEEDQYRILRKVFGSGVPIAGELRYKVKLNGEYQLEFWEVVESTLKERKPRDEHFKLVIEDHGFSLYLNGIKMEAELKTLHNTR